MISWRIVPALIPGATLAAPPAAVNATGESSYFHVFLLKEPIGNAKRSRYVLYVANTNLNVCFVAKSRVWINFVSFHEYTFDGVDFR